MKESCIDVVSRSAMTADATPVVLSSTERFRFRFMPISEKWGICARRVQTLCTEGRIEGAQRVGHQWIIPANALKPKDARVKSGKYIKSKNENGEDIDEQKTI